MIMINDTSNKIKSKYIYWVSIASFLLHFCFKPKNKPILKKGNINAFGLYEMSINVKT